MRDVLLGLPGREEFFASALRWNPTPNNVGDKTELNYKFSISRKHAVQVR